MPTKKKPPATAAAPARRRELLDKAIGVFADLGYNATTVRRIADEVGMLAGSLYYYFESKDAMLEEILRTFLDELWEGTTPSWTPNRAPGKPSRRWSSSRSGRSTGIAPPSRSTRAKPNS